MLDSLPSLGPVRRRQSATAFFGRYGPGHAVSRAPPGRAAPWTRLPAASRGQLSPVVPPESAPAWDAAPTGQADNGAV